MQNIDVSNSSAAITSRRKMDALISIGRTRVAGTAFGYMINNTVFHCV